MVLDCAGRLLLGLTGCSQWSSLACQAELLLWQGKRKETKSHLPPRPNAAAIASPIQGTTTLSLHTDAAQRKCSIWLPHLKKFNAFGTDTRSRWWTLIWVSNGNGHVWAQPSKKCWVITCNSSFHISQFAFSLDIVGNCDGFKWQQFFWRIFLCSNAL